MLSLVAAAVLAYGWAISDERHLTAESGLGYALGIAGSLMMLALLAYPLRKRFRFMRSAGRVSFWFHAHMALGVIGPTLVLLHANFRLGSLNSSVALVCMLIVAFSGYVGRYLYRQVHVGLSRRKAWVEDTLEQATAFKERFRLSIMQDETIRTVMKEHEHRLLQPYPGLRKGLVNLAVAGTRTWFVRRRLKRHVHRLIEAHATIHLWRKRDTRRILARADELIDGYLAAVARASRFAVYERLFALWHLLHMPLFALLLIAALAHVLAVHLY